MAPKSSDTSVGCKDGPDPNLSDGIACTVDSCDEANDRAVHTPNDSTCDNGMFCDGQETCDATTGCLPGTAPNLNDGVSCTDDSCDETNDKVVHTANDANCSDGKYCNGDETCDPANGCQSGTSVSCPANDTCYTNYTCSEAQSGACVGTAVPHSISWSVNGYGSGSTSLTCSETNTVYVQTDGCKVGYDWLYRCRLEADGRLTALISGSPFNIACLGPAGPTVSSGCSTINGQSGYSAMECCFQ